VTGAAVPRQVDNVRGALWMLGSALGFTAMTVLIKFLGDDYPASLQTFYRQAAGFLIFHELPNVWTMAGAGVVVASTLFITLREQQLARSAKLSAAADSQ